jgi:hypothetical protein
MIILGLAWLGAGVLVLFVVACLDAWVVVLRARARLARLEWRAWRFRWRCRVAGWRWALRDRPWGAWPASPASLEWPALRWQLHYLARGSVDQLHLVRARLVGAPDPLPWLMAVPVLDRDALALPTSRAWWRCLWWSAVAGPCWRALTLLGVWEVAPCARYREGRWRWRFWATPRSYWALRCTPHRFSGGWWGYVWRGW